MGINGSAASRNWFLWLVHEEIVEQDIRPTSGIGAGDQANVAATQGVILGCCNLFSIHRQSQVAADTIHPQVVGRSTRVDAIHLG